MTINCLQIISSSRKTKGKKKKKIYKNSKKPEFLLINGVKLFWKSRKVIKNAKRNIRDKKHLHQIHSRILHGIFLMNRLPVKGKVRKIERKLWFWSTHKRIVSSMNQYRAGKCQYVIQGIKRQKFQL